MVKLLVEIINDFFEPLSYKSMGFIILMMIGLSMASGIFSRQNESIPKQLKSQ